MKIENWILKIADPKKRARLLGLRQRYEFLTRQLFFEYQPTMNSTDATIREFMQRLDLWLDQFSNEEEQIAAFESIEYLFFVGTKEFNELYRCAAIKIKHWIAKRHNLNPFLPNTHLKIDSILKKSWICPVTDSFRINDFLHITNLSALDFRADWYNLCKLGDATKILDASSKAKYLILLEDFSGSGKQISKVLRFVLETTRVQILLMPMVVCSPGERRLSSIIQKYGKGRVYFDPVISLAENTLVGKDESPGEPKLFGMLRNVMESHATNVKFNKAYGFGSVGSLVVTYSNCPNTTPPLYHKALKSHQAIFPRLPRNG